MEVVEGQVSRCFERHYGGRGAAAYHTAIFLALLVYGYATRVFSSRKIEPAHSDSLAFHLIAAGHHLDHDTLSSFRRRLLTDLERIFVQVLKVAYEMKLLKLGNIRLDGAQIHANAWRHSALSYGHAEKLEARFQGEVQQELLALAELADQIALPEGMVLPAERKRREERLAAIAQTKAKIVARPRCASSRSRLTTRRSALGARPASRRPAGGPVASVRRCRRPVPAPRTRSISPMRIRASCPCAQGGFEQAYNAQAAVDAATSLVMIHAVTQASNGKEQAAPAVEALQALPEALGKA